jgi:CheY-like chemotaxis protein
MQNEPEEQTMNAECVDGTYSLNTTVPQCPNPKAASKISEMGPFDGWLSPIWLARAGAPSSEGCAPSLDDISVLFVNDQDSLASLGRVLTEHLLLDVTHVRNCHEAAEALASGEIPDLILTDTRLPDGSWEDILKLAANPPVNVLLVSRIGNIGLYREAIIQGAYDFITPNIPPAAFVQLLIDAKEDVCLQRKSVSISTPASLDRPHAT